MVSLNLDCFNVPFFMRQSVCFTEKFEDRCTKYTCKNKYEIELRSLILTEI